MAEDLLMLNISSAPVTFHKKQFEDLCQQQRNGHRWVSPTRYVVAAVIAYWLHTSFFQPDSKVLYLLCWC